MKVGIFREHGADARLERIDTVTVPDTSTTPEQAAWAAWTRAHVPPPGNYAVLRLGQRFSADQRQQVVSTALGAMQ